MLLDCAIKDLLNPSFATVLVRGFSSGLLFVVVTDMSFVCLLVLLHGTNRAPGPITRIWVGSDEI